MANRLRRRSSSRGLGLFGLPVLAVSLVAACTTAASATPSSTPPASAAASPAAASPSPSPSLQQASPGVASPSSLPGQTKTAWGLIWDALPATFPHYPGAEPTDTKEGPSSASLALPTQPKTASVWWTSAMTELGYQTEGIEGPLEDGSIVVHSAGSGSCKVQASFAPLGSDTLQTVFFAAACPFM
jgi:hypothetical protein